jgi:hypothetical protein
VIEISARAASDADAQVVPDVIIAWEDQHGALPAGAFVAMNSGWDARYEDAESFINLGDDDVLHFPGFHPETTACRSCPILAGSFMTPWCMPVCRAGDMPSLVDDFCPGTSNRELPDSAVDAH